MIPRRKEEAGARFAGSPDPDSRRLCHRTGAASAKKGLMRFGMQCYNEMSKPMHSAREEVIYVRTFQVA